MLPVAICYEHACGSLNSLQDDTILSIFFSHTLKQVVHDPNDFSSNFKKIKNKKTFQQRQMLNQSFFLYQTYFRQLCKRKKRDKEKKTSKKYMAILK